MVDPRPPGLILRLKLESGNFVHREKHCCPLVATGQSEPCPREMQGNWCQMALSPTVCQDPVCSLWGTAKGQTCPAFDLVKGQFIFSDLQKGS